MKTKLIIKLNILGFLVGILIFGNINLALASESTTKEIILLVNQERKNAGLNELRENEILNQAATLKANDMIGNNYFAHTSPAGVDPWHWFNEAGYKYKYAGENLAMDFSSANTVHKAWMKSETHRENIMSEKYFEIGVAVMDGILENRETKVAVQLFGTRLSDQQISLAGESINETPSFNIIEASIHPWKVTDGDEAIVYAKVSGDPQQVHLLLNGKEFELIKHREGVYMNMFTLKEIDISSKEAIMVAKSNDKEVFFQIPKSQYEAFLEKKEEQEKNTVSSVASIRNEEAQSMKDFTKQNLALGIGLVAFLVLIVNIWILEKEEEKLLKLNMSV